MIRIICICAIIIACSVGQTEQQSGVIHWGGGGTPITLKLHNLHLIIFGKLAAFRESEVKFASIDYADRCVNLQDIQMCSLRSKTDCVSAKDAVATIKVPFCVRLYTENNCIGSNVEYRHGRHNPEPFKSVGACPPKVCKRIDKGRLQKRSQLVEMHQTVDGNEVVAVSRDLLGVAVPELIYVMLYYVGSQSRTNFRGAAIEERFVELGALWDDDRGHLVASAVGGPAEDWNLAPMQRRLNRGDGSANNWRRLERRVADFLKEGQICGTRRVQWTVYINYGQTSRRPNNFTVEAVFFDGDTLIESKAIECSNIRSDGLFARMCEDYDVQNLMPIHDEL